ncbi:pyridoxal-phosphate dependent enzyme [Chitinophaga sp. MM2321]|uniref:pyridoxal-phosphate dependent enzyme n=1 Tax=Chitinophaga sp. MM2321 TaxID=3137178 RepID=UPI0032D576A8
MKGIWTYSHLLPGVQEDCKLTLGEGHTPLVKSKRIGPSIGLDNLYFKLEILNPSGSYKDRFAAAAVSHLKQQDVSFCLATSSGNTGAALAAYSAAAGIPCFLAIVDGAPSGKLQQMQVYGATTMMIKDFGKDLHVTGAVFSGLNDLADKYGSPVQISAYCYSPLGMAGVQTIAYEIAEELGAVNAHVFSPAGGGGLTLAVAKGFQLWKEQHAPYMLPKVHCVQPVGNNTIAGPLHAGAAMAQEVDKSSTTISGLQVPGVMDGNEVIAACRATGGTGYAVTDELIYACQSSLSAMEGIYCEPAGAVALAGLQLALERGEINREDHVVCLVTGHGFKDPVAAQKMADKSAGLYFNNTGDAFLYLKSTIKNKK